MSDTTEILGLLQQILNNQSDRDTDRVYDALKEIANDQKKQIAKTAALETSVQALQHLPAKIGGLENEITKITTGAGVISAIVSMIIAPIVYGLVMLLF